MNRLFQFLRFTSSLVPNKVKAPLAIVVVPPAMTAVRTVGGLAVGTIRTSVRAVGFVGSGASWLLRRIPGHSGLPSLPSSGSLNSHPIDVYSGGMARSVYDFVTGNGGRIFFAGFALTVLAIRVSRGKIVVHPNRSTREGVEWVQRHADTVLPLLVSTNVAGAICVCAALYLVHQSRTNNERGFLLRPSHFENAPTRTEHLIDTSNLSDSQRTRLLNSYRSMSNTTTRNE